MLSKVNPNLPPVVDLRQWAGPVKDQGDEGACTAHAGSSAMEWIFRRYHSRQPILSPQYLYAQELIADGDFPNDNGSDGTTLCTTMIRKGCCDLSLYPYVSGQIKAPNVAQDQNAAQYQLGAFHGLVSSAVALSVIGDPTPWPVLVGFTVFESFESDEVAQTGIMPIPQPGETIMGGHEVLMLGYDLPNKTALILNSWGESWGQKGYFVMPLAILDRQDTDLKIAHSGAPWK